MKTRAFFLSVMLMAFDSHLSKAEVFSPHAVGYVNTVIPANALALISNPLDAGDNNTIAMLFTDAAEAAGGLTVYKFITEPSPHYLVFIFNAETGLWDGDDAYSETTLPGEGVFVRNSSGSAITVTFVGAFSQGELHNQIPRGLSIKSSMVPQEGTLTQLGYVPSGADQIYQFDATTQRWHISSYDVDFQTFTPPLRPLRAGEAVFIRSENGGSWDRTFFVNQ